MKYRYSNDRNPHMKMLLHNIQRTVLVLFIFTLFGTTGHAQDEKKAVSIMDAYTNRNFYSMGIPSMHWMNDGESYSFGKRSPKARSMSIYKADAVTGDEELILDIAELTMPGSDEAFSYRSYSWSPQENYLLFTLATKQIWRHSFTGEYIAYDLGKEEFIQLPKHEEGIRNLKFSPDETKIGYVYKDDLYVYDLESKEETQLTFDAEEHVFNGRFGWVYEEEFSITDGWRWSPDSRRIAYWQEDESMVPVVTMTDWTPDHYNLIPIRYPKAGDPNPIMKIGVVELETKETTWMNIGDEVDMYIPRIYWTNQPHTLCIVWMNRLQNEVELILADATDGESRVILSESSKTGWIEIEDDFVRFLKNSDTFIWASERSGWKHLYHYDYQGELIDHVTGGKWEVTAVEGLSEDESLLYYSSTEVSPLERHLYSITLNGKDKKKLTKTEGSHSINLSPGGKYYVDRWSSLKQPTNSILFNGSGEQVRVLKAKTAESYTSAFKWQDREIHDFTTEDGVKIYLSIIKPVDFDPNKKYPVYMDVYGGPGYQVVRNRWPSPVQQWVAGEGFIVVQVDNRGGGGRGTEFKHAVYKELGKWEAHDYIAAAKYLGELPYVDKDNVGIWGWSYGGYMSALTLLLGSDYFKAAVAIAPVTDWKFYDTIYAERYMQRPQDNPEGYKVGSCLEHAEKLEGKLLLIHGGMDDNVHVQNTMQFVHLLEEAGKDFDMRIYPNGNHGIVGSMKSRVAMYKYFMNFFKEHLQ
jgi:dipeptidyl-peptidase 4